MAKAKAAPQEVELTAPAEATAPVAPAQLVASPTMKSWQVSLVDQPTIVVQATDRDGAIAAYNAANGIIQTDHAHAVVEVN